MARLRRSLLVFGAWSLVGAFDLTRGLVQGLAGLGPAPSEAQAVMTLESVWLWAAFTPLLFALAERLPIERGRVARPLALHAALAVGFAAADVVVDHACAALFAPAAQRPLAARFVGESFINLYSYFAVLGVGLALRYHRLWTERQLRVARLETQLVEANLAALERQLRPHFLYNTLHTIGALVRAQRGGEAIRVLAALGDLLRESLRAHDGHEVALASEVDFAQRYLAIEEVRFGGRLAVRFDVDERARAARVPRFLLQPIVENAVRHGVERCAAGGTVTVRAARDGDMLRVEVHDTGCGATTPVRDGIGLGATRARLAQLYGEAHRFELAHDAGGTVVRVALPLREAARDAALEAAE